MKQKIERSLLLAFLLIGLSCAWLAPLDKYATTAVDSGLNRALVSFASARTLNAVLSVAQSADVSAKPLGFGVSITVGQALHPINELVGQFAELMLAASVAFGAMKLLIVIGAYKGVSLLLSLVALWWSWLRWQGKPWPSLLSKTLLLLVLIRFAVPVVSLGSEVVFDEFLVNGYTAAQHGIANIPSSGNGLWSGKAFNTHVENLKQSAESGVVHMVNLIAVFLLQTLVVPLFLFWILYRIGSAMLNSAPRNN